MLRCGSCDCGHASPARRIRSLRRPAPVPLFRLHQLQPIRRPQDLHLTNQRPDSSVSFLPDAPVAQSSYWCEPEQSRAAPSCLGARAPWRHRPGPGSGVQVSSAEMADSSLLSSLIGRDLSGPCCHWPEMRALKGSSLARRRHEARAQRLAPELLLALVRVTHCVSS